MTWVVTGAGGQLGLALSKQLTLEGVDFIPLLSNQLDITNIDQVNEVISRLKPRIIVNTAAWTDVDRAEKNKESVFAVNEKGVENLALAAKVADSIFIQISSDYVFSGESNEPVNVLSKLEPKNVYGFSKAAGEIAVREVYSEGSYIVRTAWLYSEFGKNFAKTMCRLAIESNKEVKVVSDQVGQPSNANDLARQLIRLVKTNANFGIYHGTNAGQASWYEFANQIFKLCAADTGRLISVPTSEFPRSANRPKYSVLGHSAWDAVGIPPMQDWKTALEQSMSGILASVQMEE